MSPRAWSLSPLELTVLWHALGREILPYPLQHRPTQETVEEYERAYKSAATRVQSIFDEDLYGPLRILIEPEARIEVAGFARSAEGVRPGAEPDPMALIRLHAAVSGQSAVMLTQESTPDPYRGGPVRMAIVGTRTIAARIIASLPSTPRGSGPSFRINRADLDAYDDQPFTGLGDETPRSPRTEVQRFFERPRTTLAHIAVYPGPAYDNRPTATRDFHVMDYPDGRYRVHSAAAIQAVPAEAADLTAHLQAVLDRTLQQYWEDTDPVYT
ncbi:ESX secretion-associated protein EspG [Nocardia bovistercoris]|uniref:ESX secretion-associated protein EspG n=1 Tax=Nocardia bovistercoris TaxID=2785916 RepID=A0A931N410_9NOCA|nr:ESX secretion-associated protein EspG [Nocardia bovistercoris]MBH0778267.1 ESX secretion-associated protein EspG [Nocardia bovistercoris]